MHANHFATIRTNPLLFFTADEFPDSLVFDHREIFDHAHSVPGPVALIQLFQPGTWESVTAIGTIPDFAAGNLFTVFDPTGRAAL